MWTGTVLLPPGRSLEAKLVVVDGSPSGRWEPGGNRSFMVQAPSIPPSRSLGPSPAQEAGARGDTMTDCEDISEEIDLQDNQDTVGMVSQYDGDTHRHHGEGFSNGWLDPGSCADRPDTQEKEDDEGPIRKVGGTEEDTDVDVGLASASSSSTDARSPEIALVFHWGLSTFSQV